MPQRRMRLPRSRISPTGFILYSIPSYLSSILKTGRGILVPPSALDDAARLRTSVANDENQTQGDSADRVDEGPRRVDNKKSEGRFRRSTQHHLGYSGV